MSFRLPASTHSPHRRVCCCATVSPLVPTPRLSPITGALGQGILPPAHLDHAGIPRGQGEDARPSSEVRRSATGESQRFTQDRQCDEFELVWECRVPSRQPEVWLDRGPVDRAEPTHSDDRKLLRFRVGRHRRVGVRDVLQAGTETEIIDVGIFSFTQVYAWWEWFPAGEVAITNLRVSPGDVMYCLICVNSTTTATVYISNQSSLVTTSFSITAPRGDESGGKLGRVDR